VIATIAISSATANILELLAVALPVGEDSTLPTQVAEDVD